MGGLSAPRRLHSLTVSSRTKILVIALLVEGVVLLIALLLSWFFRIPLSPLSEHPFRDILLGTFWASVPFGLFVFTLSNKVRTVPMLRSIRKTLLEDVKALFSVTGWIDIGVIALLAGFAEELLFRGIIQAKLGLVPASIMFGLLHCVTPAYIVIATVVGFYIGVVYTFYHSLLVPIQLHFAYDLVALIYLKYFVKEECG